MVKRLLPFVLVGVVCAHASEAQYPAVTEETFVLKDFQFRSGESLPELRLHYRTLGRPQRDVQGVVRNAVLIMHGTGGSGAQFLRPEFAGELFRSGGLLDSTFSISIAARFPQTNPSRRDVEASRLAP